MRDSIYRLTLDMLDLANQVQITAKQNDTQRTLSVMLTEDGHPYVLEAGMSAVILIKKPSGNIIMNDCDLVFTDNSIRYEFTAQTVVEVGLCECEIRLYGGTGQVLSTPRFTIRVTATVYDDGQVESEDEFMSLTEAITATNNLNIGMEQDEDEVTITITHKDGTTTSATIMDGTMHIEELEREIEARASKVVQGTTGNLVVLTSDGDMADSGYNWSDIPAPVDISGKADKVAGGVYGNLAGIGSGGNLSDSGVKASEVAAAMSAIPSKADMVEGATSGNLAALNSDGNLVDSGHSWDDVPEAVDISGKADKVTDAVSGHLAQLDSNGNLSDSGLATSDLTNVARKPNNPTNGNLVKMNGQGVLQDSGKAVSDIPEVVGTTGTATNKVMHQKAVTEQLAVKMPLVDNPTNGNIPILMADGSVDDSGYPFTTYIQNQYIHTTTSDIQDGDEWPSGYLGNFIAVYEAPVLMSMSRMMMSRPPQTMDTDEDTETDTETEGGSDELIPEVPSDDDTPSGDELPTEEGDPNA